MAELILIWFVAIAVSTGLTLFMDWFKDRARGIKATDETRENITIGAIVRINGEVDLVFKKNASTRHVLVTCFNDKSTNDEQAVLDLGVCAYPYGVGMQAIPGILGIKKEKIDIIIFPGYGGDIRSITQEKGYYGYTYYKRCYGYTYYPVGTLIVPTGYQDIGMIVGHFMENEDDGKSYDYGVITYTEDYHVKDVIYINNSDIESVIRVGHMDDEQDKNMCRVEKAMYDTKKKFGIGNDNETAE